MEKKYTVAGMTCEGCKAKVKYKLEELPEVNSAKIDLNKKEAVINLKSEIGLKKLQTALTEKYPISNHLENTVTPTSEPAKNKFDQLKPLFLILFYIASASILLHYKNWSWSEFMLDFMGLFYIVFSFFKMLDLKGFPMSFMMYDPLAKRVPFYGKIYPFIETALGIMFLMRIEITVALIMTILILGITTIGVTKTLLDKKTIRCACLGTTLNLPMTEATFIENAIMVIMASIMLSTWT